MRSRLTELPEGHSVYHLAPHPCPYLTLKEAAQYCGYSARQFRRHVEQFSIPAKGPRRNRFCVADLDAWMDNPSVFLKPILSRNGKRFTPVMA